MPDNTEETGARTPQPIRLIVISAAVLCLCVFIFFMFWKAFHVLLLFFAGMLVSSLLRGLGKFIASKTPLSEGWGTLAGTLLILGLLVGFGFWVAPGIGEQAQELRQQLPTTVAQLRHALQGYSWAEPLLSALEKPSELLKNGSAFSYAQSVFGAVFGVLGDFYVILLIGAFFALQPKVYRQGIAMLVPKSKRPRLHTVMDAIAWTLQHWLAGILLNIGITGILTWIALSIIGVPLALVLGFLTAIFNFIPNFGPLLAAVPVALMAFTQGNDTLLYAMIAYFAINIMASNILTPLLQHWLVKIPLGLIILAQTLLGAVTGALGLTLATPIAAVIMVCVKMLYVEDALGDNTSLKAEEKVTEGQDKA